MRTSDARSHLSDSNDEQLVALLTQRDGPLPERPRQHQLPNEGCRYGELYPKGNCPWCRQTAGVIEIAMRARRPVVILEEEEAPPVRTGLARLQVS
jgi:hypothetical protein